MKRSFSLGIRDGVKRLFVPAVPDLVRSRNSLRSEIAAHVDARVAYLVERGMSAEDARRDAVDRFGGDIGGAVAQLETSVVSRDRRMARGDRFDGWRQDARFVVRSLRRAPAFTAGVVATLALGLGSNSAVFRVADRVLTRAPAGVRDAGALRRVSILRSNGSSAPIESQNMSFPTARAVADSKAFGSVALYAPMAGVQTADGHDIAITYVDSGYFNALGVRPAVGRFFDATEAEPGTNYALAVASYDYWVRELGAASLAATAPIRIRDKSYRVIGVAPRGFSGVELDPIDLWLPLGIATFGRGIVNGTEIPWYRMDMTRSMRAVARLTRGVSDQRAAAQAGAALPAPNGPFAARLSGIRLATLHEVRDASGGDGSASLLARLILVAAVVLLIASANAANLLLARGLRRRREVAVRLALGASQGQIIRLLVLESVALALLGGVAAGIVGFWIGEALRRLVFPDARWTSTALDMRTLAFTATMSIVAGLLVGVAPALHMANPDLVTGLKDNRYQSGNRSHRTRAALIVIQTAFSLSLLIASGLVVRSLHRLNDVDLGFDASGLVTVELAGPVAFDPNASGSRIEAVDLAQRVSHERTISAIALSSNAPFGSFASMSVSVPGRPDPEIPPAEGPWYNTVSPEFFATMGIGLVRGRLFASGDIRGAQPVAIVNERMARSYWRDGDPLTGCILARGMCARVIGVVRDVRDFHSVGAPPPRYYYALAQQADTMKAVVIRTIAANAAHVTQIVRPLIPSTQRATVRVIQDRVESAMRPWRVATLLFASLGGIALALSCVGLYSVMSYITSERVAELGIRRVLGASSENLVWLVLSGGLRLVGAGIALGLAATALGARLLAALLFGVSPFDPLVYAGGAIALVIVAALAMLLPSAHVLRIDLTAAIRAD
jgi:predicted permease